MTMNARQYLNIEELSAQTRVAVSTLRRYVREQKIKYFQPGGKGGRLLFPPDALERAGQPPVSPDAHRSNPLPGRRPKWDS